MLGTYVQLFRRNKPDLFQRSASFIRSTMHPSFHLDTHFGVQPTKKRSSTQSPLFHDLATKMVHNDDILLEPLFTGQAIHVGEYPDSPIDRIKQIINNDTGTPKVFCELMELSQDHILPDGDYVWQEKARWIKYEETVEEGGTRFSKPHITLMTIQSLLQLKNCLKRGATLFDVQPNSLQEAVDMLVKNWTHRHALSDAAAENITQVLMGKKIHLVRSRMRHLSAKKPKMTPILSAGQQDAEGEETDREDDAAASSSGLHNVSLLKKLPSDSESAIILIGHLVELSVPISEFVRFRTPVNLHPDLPEIPVPVRFLFILLIPHDHYQNEATQIGSCLGALLADEIFGKVAYNAKEAHDLTDGIEEFMSQTLIIPAAKWNRQNRFEPPDDMVPEERYVGKIVNKTTADEVVQVAEKEDTISRTGRLFGGLVKDFKRKSRWYLSDYGDAFRGRLSQTLAATIFLFFANITKIITFGGVMGIMLKNRMGTVENLLSGGICGVVYALFAGQPIAVLSATGPTLVFEFIMYDLCEQVGFDFLVARFWLGLWTALLLMVIVATEASVIIGLITRFTEEAFATLISIIFIVQAFQELLEIGHHAPITRDPTAVLTDPCVCLQPNGTTPALEMHSNFTKENCSAIEWVTSGAQCDFHPDVFLFSVILFFGTFTIAIGMKKFRNSGFLPSKIRQTVADFNVLSAIVVMTAINLLVGLDVPRLAVPAEFKPTMERPWLVNPLNLEHWWIPLVMALPGIFLTILVFMDQQITAVIINRKDNRLRKSHGYHLDLVVIAILMIVCSLIGIPFYVAATVISIIHLESLKVMSECSAPGERPQFLGVKEQRVSALVAHILIGLSVVLTPVIKIVPMPVLLGVFLYMGTVSLIGQELVQRFKILFMPMKHQPDYRFLRLVHLKRVHLFTFIQLLCLGLLFVVKYIKSISMIFPLMLIVMVIVRKFLMDRVFTKKELLALDDPVPTIRTLLKARPLLDKRVIDPDMGFFLAEESSQLVTERPTQVLLDGGNDVPAATQVTNGHSEK